MEQNKKPTGAEGTADRAAASASRVEAFHQGQESTEPVKESVRGVMEQAKEWGREALTKRKENVAAEVEGVAQALRKAAEELGSREQTKVASYADRTADALEWFSEAVRERDLDSVLDQTRKMARRQPALVVGGAVAAGFMLVRFLKSSGDSLQESGNKPGNLGGETVGTDPLQQGAGTGSSGAPAGSSGSPPGTGRG